MLSSLRTSFARLHWLFLALLSIPALWYLLIDGLPTRFDRGLHIMRLAWLDQQVRQGSFFPRWMPEMMLGRGYPLFNFYGSGVYYLSELFYLVGFNLSDASVATLVVLVLLAGVGVFLLSRDMFGKESNWASLIAAIAYMYAPYFLTVNIYQRGAVAEATAQALMPWVLWSVRRLFTSEAQALWAIVLALLLSALVFSHTLMLLIFPPFLTGYVLIQWLQNGRNWRGLGWAILGLVAAIGVTAFFWLPLITERNSLSKLAYNIVRGAILPRATWTWDTYVAKEWLYTYARPPRLGLVQLLLGTAGALCFIIWRRTWENWYLLFSAVVAGLLVGSWARPLWASSEILLSIQSPWRLLTLITLVLAIFTGEIVAYFPLKRLRIPLALLLLGVIIYTNMPRLPGMPFFSRTDAVLTPVSLAQQETEQGVETGGEGNTFVQEFRPVWAGRSLLYTNPPTLTVPALQMQPLQANDYTTAISVTVPEGAPLRFNQFYFPGWQVKIDGDKLLPTYPSTNVGLLTVDLPPGSHHLTLAWNGTTTQQVAGIISMVALALLALLSWQQGWRKTSLIPLFLIVVGLVATFSRPALAQVTTPTQSLEGEGVRYLGYHSEQSDPAYLTIHPFWYVLAGGPNPNFQAHWQLLDETGAVRSELISGPYYNASNPRTWPPGTLIEDAYRLPLPPGLPAGSYTLALQLPNGDEAGGMIKAGAITLSKPVPPQVIPAYAGAMAATKALFGDEIALAGFATPASKTPLTDKDAPLVYHAGEDATYRLYWHAAKTPTHNYHSYIHLLDSAGNEIAGSDQLPGPWFRPPKGWDTYYLQQDTHVLEIPADAPGGLYWPSVGLYEIRNMDILSLTVDGQPVPGSVYRLPPIKVIGAPAKPSTAHVARFDDGFHLLGYDLMLPPEGLHPGAEFKVKLYYQSDAKTSKDYTRFFHLYSPELGIAAQFDSPPQGGINPTSVWIPGETIIDTVSLQVAEDAKPGDYRLFMGFYDAQAGGARLGVKDEAGQPLPDSGVVLQTATVQPK